MPRPRNPFPTPRNHKGAAVVDVYDATGTRRTVTLGPWGSEAAQIEFDRLRAELRAGTGRNAPAKGANRAGPAATVNEVLLAFLKYADAYYVRPDGTATHEVVQYRVVARHLREACGHLPAAEFGPRLLEEDVRKRFIDSGWCRNTINRQVGRVRRVFKWAAGKELVPFETYHRLTAVEGLRRGRAGVRESEPVAPVAEGHARAVFPFVRPQVRGMIEVQLLTGMRPDEVCRLRPCEVDTTAAVWVYRPDQHKNAWRGKPRVVAIGPRAQAVLAEFAPADPAEYYFSPRRAVQQLHAERTKGRATPRYPSHVARNAAKRTTAPKRPPAERYSSMSYGHAVTRGIDRANKAAKKAAAAGACTPIPYWAPNQLRHAKATLIRAKYGLEAAGAALGHDQLSTTEIYAEKNLELAIRVATEMG